MKIKCLESKFFLLWEQLAIANSWAEALEQEKSVLIRGLEVARSREHTTLEEISSMLSWDQSAEEMRPLWRQP